MSLPPGMFLCSLRWDRVESQQLLKLNSAWSLLIFCCKGHILGFVKVSFCFFLADPQCCGTADSVGALADPDHYHFSSSGQG